MTTINSLDRQPTVLDYASPVQFRFTINQLPKTQFFVTAANIPGINLGDAVFPTPLKSIPVMGDDLVFENLEVTFLVDEQLQNYREIHNWMVAIGFPKSRQQFTAFRNENNDRLPERGGSTKSDQSMFADATMTILTSKNNPILEARFNNVYPVALSALQYNSQEADIAYLTASVTFQYSIYEFYDL
jgi:hypothetical protein